MVSAVILRVTLPPEGDALVILAHELACCAVRYTGPAITTQIKVGGAGTFVTTPGGQQAQVATATIVDFAGVIGHIWLAQSMEDVKVHGPVQGADEQCFVGARGLVGPVDGLGFPICPVDVIFK